MFDWLKSRYSFGKESLSITRLIAIPAIFSIALLVYRNLPALAQGQKTLWGIPDWFWALETALLLLFFFVFEYGHKQYLSIQPKFSIRFIPETCIASALSQVVNQLPNGIQVVVGDRHKARYVRVQLDALSKIALRDCVIGITKLEKRLASEKSFKSVTVPQTIFLHEKPFELYPEIPKHVDFLATNENDNKLRTTPNLNWPFILLDLFDDNGTYRFTFKANAHGVTQTKAIDIKWDGRWDTIWGSEV